MKTEQGTPVWLWSGGKRRYAVNLKVKVKQVDRAGVEMAGTKSSSSAVKRRIQKQPAVSTRTWPGETLSMPGEHPALR